MGRRLEINTKTLKFVLMIMPFFPLYCLDMFFEQNISGSLVAYAISRILALGRWGITAWAFIYFFKKKYKCGFISKTIAFFSIMRIIASICNGSFGLGMIIGNLTYIGFALLIEILVNKDKKHLLESNEVLFSSIAIIGTLTIFAFPNGFNLSTNKESAIYLFGSKNSGFYYYFLCVFFITLHNVENSHRYIAKVSILCILFSVAAMVTSSSNTLVCLLLLLLYFVITYIMRNRLIIKPQFAIIFVALIGLFFLSGKQVNWVNDILTVFGRDLTFTGRDYIWKIFLEGFSKHPIWGVGYDVVITLKSGAIANHAHNFFLDNLVKYGIIEFISLIILILSSGKAVAKKQNKTLKGFYSLILFVILLHSLLDDVSIYLLILIFLCFDKYGCEKFRKTRFKRSSYEV